MYSSAGVFALRLHRFRTLPHSRAGDESTCFTLRNSFLGSGGIDARRSLIEHLHRGATNIRVNLTVRPVTDLAVLQPSADSHGRAQGLSLVDVMFEKHSSGLPFGTANGDDASNVARISHRLLSAVSSFLDSNSRARSLLLLLFGASWLQFCFGHDPARDAYRATRGGAGPRLRHAVRSATCSPSSEVFLFPKFCSLRSDKTVE
jgi:hypothetical protein